jgi:hypothetical protein
MSAGEVHVGDVGTGLEVTLKDQAGEIVDISGATVKQIIFKKPDGQKVIKDATFTTDGTDAKMVYVTVAGDLDTPGAWSIQGRVVLPAGEWSSDVSQFKVFPNL